MTCTVTVQADGRMYYVTRMAIVPTSKSMAFASIAILGVGGALAFGVGCESTVEGPSCDAETALDLYERRIEPIFADDRPSSCNQCHLSGIDLETFVKDSPCQTMACMVEKNLVDLDNPDESLVLSWIERAEPESELITDDVIQAEYDAMREWIEFHGSCNADVCEPIENPCELDGKAPACKINDLDEEYEPPEGCDDIVIEEMFLNLVYRYRGRCWPCHWTSPDVPTPDDAPKWLVDGACNNASLETMRNIIDAGYVDLDEPAQSLILLKPLSEEAGGLEHGGGEKIHDENEEAYGKFITWLERYASCQETVTP